MKRFKIIGNPLFSDSAAKQTKITCSEDLAALARGSFPCDTITVHETFMILLFNRANKCIGDSIVSNGGTAATVVDIKMIAKVAIDVLASSIALVHNHPSGNLNPSNEDIKITKKIKAGLELLDVQVLDHIILTEDGYYSLMVNGDV